MWYSYNTVAGRVPKLCAAFSGCLLVARDNGGSYGLYLWNLPVPGDWRYADAVARNPSARAVDLWVIPQLHSVALVAELNQGAHSARLGVLENFGGDYSLYVWNAPLPGDLTQADAGARNPSLLGRDCWMIPAGNSAVALFSPR